MITSRTGLLPLGRIVLAIPLVVAGWLALVVALTFGTAPGRSLGEHPDKGGPILVKSGRYGPYVSHDGVNASLPTDKTPETITLEEAVSLLDARAASAKPPAERRRPARAAAKTKSPRAKAAPAAVAKTEKKPSRKAKAAH